MCLIVDKAVLQDYIALGKDIDELFEISETISVDGKKYTKEELINEFHLNTDNQEE